MKLTMYIYRRFIPVFAGATVFFSFVLELVDLLVNLWKFIINQADPAAVLHLMVLYIPKTVSYSVPLAVLFAASYTLSDFYANNELMAVFASGVSLLRFTAPLLALSFVMSFGMFFFEDNVVVSSYAEKQSLQRILLKQPDTRNSDRIVVLSEQGDIIYKAEFYDDSSRRLVSLYVVVRDRTGRPEAILHADSAAWNPAGKRWSLNGGTQYTVVNGLLEAGPVQTTLEARLTEPPGTFRNTTVSVDEVSVAQAGAYIDHLLRTGLPSAEARSLYYKKFSFPFVIFIVVFLSVGLSGKTMKNVLLTSLAFSVGAAVLFYVTQMVTMLLARFGYISPFAGAWIPVFLFIILSMILLRFSRT